MKSCFYKIGSKRFIEQADRFCVLLASFALLAMYVGASFKLAILLAVIAFFIPKLVRIRPDSILKNLLFLYPLYILLIQYQQWWNGTQGLAFGIFTQVIDRVAQTGRFESSLIATSWSNFITHHFSPYLICLGLVARVGIPAHLVLIGAHTLAAAMLVTGLVKLCARITRDLSLARALTALIILLPSVRRGMSWETHDDILALPFLVWSMLLFER
jgi:hypothetical protein